LIRATVKILSKNQPMNPWITQTYLVMPFAGILPKPNVLKAFRERVRALINEMMKPNQNVPKLDSSKARNM